jgi:NitT/TauT family transport system substrate-binding protein
MRCPFIKSVALAVAAIATIALPFGAIAQTPAQAPEKKKLTIAVGGKNLFYYLPLSVAEKQGYFKDEGLDVEIPDFAGGAKALQALVGGSADLVSGAYEHTINMQAKNQQVKAVVLQAAYNSIVLIMPKEKAAAYKGPQDLKGLKIGVTAPGSSTNMFVSNLLAKGGLKPDAASYIGVGAGAGAVAAMLKGEIDAMSNLDPVISQLEASGKYVAVADSRTAKGMQDLYGGAYHASVIYAMDDFVKKNPNTVQAVTNAMVRSLRWIDKATPDQIMAIMPKEVIGDAAVYKASLEKNKLGYSKDGQLSMDAAKNVLAVLKQFEPSVMAAPSIDLAKTFDNSFAAKAAAKYK